MACGKSWHHVAMNGMASGTCQQVYFSGSLAAFKLDSRPLGPKDNMGPFKIKI